MLSRDERRQLREIEAWFVRDDPRFAEYVRNGPVADRSLWILRLLIPIGAAIMIFGLVSALPVAVFLGICCAVVSFALSNYLTWRNRHH